MSTRPLDPRASSSLTGAQPLTRAAESQPAVANPQRATQPAPQPNSGAGVATLQGSLAPRPAPIAVPTMKAATAPERQTYAEIATRLEPLVAEQVAELIAVMEAKGLEPADTRMVFAFDITGDQRQVCSFCGRHGCGYRPVNYRTQNVEIDLLEDSMVVFLETARRVGISYGLTAYDEQVLPLRDVQRPSESAGEHETIIQRYRAFKNRHSYPDPANRAWLDQQLAKWQPEMATQSMAGEANDASALKIGRTMLERGEGEGAMGLMVSKSVAPRASLKSQELILAAKKIHVVGVAVGKNAPAVAAAMFKDTAQAGDGHALRENIGRRMIALLDKSNGQPKGT